MSSDPILLLRGLGVDHRMWTLQLPALRALGDVYAPDLPGFGEEPPLGGSALPLAAYADWVAERVRARWPSRSVAVAGYSMGGTLALLLTLRHPEVVSRLVLACSPPLWVHGWRRILPLFLHRATAGAAMEVFQTTVVVGARFFRSEPSHRREVDDMVRRADRGTMVALCRALARLDLRRELASVEVPALVITGTRDLWLPVGVARALADGFPRGRLHIIEGAGHMLCVSRAPEFGGVLAEFFSDQGV